MTPRDLQRPIEAAPPLLTALKAPSIHRHPSASGLRRISFIKDARLLYRSLRSLRDLGGLVLRLGLGTDAASLMSFSSLIRASRLLASWVLNLRPTIRTIPSVPNLFPASLAILDRVLSVMDGLSVTLNSRRTAVSSLFTFWPPGPEDLMNSKEISDSGIRISLTLKAAPRLCIPKETTAAPPFR